jgi:hypothetical protein
MTGTRFNAKGALVPCNYQIRIVSPGRCECTGCGRVFKSGDMSTPPNFAGCRDTGRFDALNRARATRHADACKGRPEADVDRRALDEAIAALVRRYGPTPAMRELVLYSLDQATKP